MKHFFIATALTVIGLSSFAQRTNKIRVGIDLGYTVPKGGGGLLFAIEPKFNLTNNLNVGFRLGSALMAKEVGATNPTEGLSSLKGTVSGNSFYLATVEHFFNKRNRSFAPYIGAGLGLHKIAAVSFDDALLKEKGIDKGITLASENKMGGLVRAGFESGKFRLGAEYNIVPESKYNEGRASASNSYLGIHLGFFIGGGRWGDAAR